LNNRKLIKTLLLIFVVFSFALLVYREFSPKSESNAINVTDTRGNKISVSDESMPVQESLTAREATGRQLDRGSSMQTAKKTQTAKVIAYYFHGTFRCTTCRTIEKYSKGAIEHYFANELKNGTLEFKPLNVEDAENRHFIQDYRLFTRSLVLSLNQDGKETKWTNLKEVWTHVRDKERFFQYVKDEVEIFLKEAQ